MQELLVPFYLVPALIVAGCIWACLRVLHVLGAGVIVRRTAFIVLATVLLSPIIVPAGTIFIAYVPSAFAVLSGELPPMHNARLVDFTLKSFAATAVLAIVLAIPLVRPRELQLPGFPKRLVHTVRPLAFILASILVYRALLPDRTVAPHIDWALLESAYGPWMNDVAAIAEIDDPETRQAERQRLARMLGDDPVIVGVRLYDPRLESRTGEKRLQFGTRISNRGCSSTRDGKWKHDRIWRCSAGRGPFGKKETLEYRRRSLRDGVHTTLSIELDYENLLDRFSARDAAETTTVASTDAIRYDRQVAGRWTIDQRYQATVNEERTLTGTMHVRPGTSPGTYDVTVTANVASTLRPGKEGFDRAACPGSTATCSWSETVSGTLKVRGNRVQIIFDGKWPTDHLDLRDDMMIGANPWGQETVYRRTQAR